MSADSSNPRPLKRAHLSSEQDNSHQHASAPNLSLSNLEHHPEFWFHDGNIILVADHIGFRVYRGLLAAQSTVFADMFISSSSRADESLEGCPVVCLEDDSHYDLAHLLRALLPMSPMLYDPTNPQLAFSFNELSAIIRLAHKYDIQSVQDQALRVLQEHRFTSDLAVYSGSTKQQLAFEGVHAIGAVNLARLTDTPLMLPTALFWCCHLGGALLNGWTREDGTVEHLSAVDLKLCFDARFALGREQHLVCARVFKAVPAEGCTNHAVCTHMLTWMERILVEDWVMANVHIHALCDFSEAMRAVERIGSLCEACMQMVVDRQGAERTRVWHALPRLLGIVVEGWPKPDADDQGAPGAAPQ